MSGMTEARRDVLKTCRLTALFAVLWLGLPAIVLGGEPRPTLTFVSANGRKMVVYAEGRLLFYDGFGDSARVIADVNCHEQQVIVSKHRKYLAACSQFANATTPARIFDDRGEKVGEFPLELPWKVHGVSDLGNLVILGEVLEGTSPSVVRMCDIRGNIIVEYLTDPTHLRFAGNGTPVIWGAKKGSRNAFAAVLNDKGQVVASREYPDQTMWIHEIVPSLRASTVLLVEGPRSESFADRVTIWNTKSAEYRTVAIPRNFGAIQQYPAISDNGTYAVLGLGAKAVALIDTAAGSVKLAKALDNVLDGGYRLNKILEAKVADDGKILAMGYCSGPSEGMVGYCVLGKTGKVINSKVLQDFKRDIYCLDRINLQELTSDRFAVVSPRNKVEVVDLRVLR
jgi:hypothetical protein